LNYKIGKEVPKKDRLIFVIMNKQDKPIVKFQTKLLELFEKAEQVSVQKPMNLARKKFIILFINAMIHCRSVHFTEIASKMETEVGDASNLRRIQDFFAGYRLDYRQLAMVLLFFLPDDKQAHLSIDRSNWTYGATDINILTVSVYCKGVGIPIWFEMLEDKSGGNSNTKERCYIIRQVLKILKGRQVFLYGDREFIGKEWVGFLLRAKITFYLRIKRNTRLTYQQAERSVVEWLGKRKSRRMDNVKIWGHQLSIEMKRLKTKNKDMKYQHLFVLTNATAKGACNAYQNRWSIEVFFQSIKGRGFRIEQTHLQDLNRLRKLFAMTALAFTLCLKMGIWWNEHQKEIEVKNHGYKQNSFFRHGLNKIRECLRLNKNRILKRFIRFIDHLLDRIQSAFPPKTKILM